MVIDVISPGETVNGKTLKDFIKIYWKALCQNPKNQNPVWQNNNGNQDNSFNASVDAELYMLSPSMNPQTSITRNITVPNGKGLFIPVLPVLASEFETAPLSLPIVAAANTDQGGINSVSLELDGSSISLEQYKVAASNNDRFQVNFPSPQDAIFNISQSGTCDAVAAGRYVWTKPLSPGQHTVHYKGSLHCSPPCLEEDYSEDMTYNITVG